MRQQVGQGHFPVSGDSDVILLQAASHRTEDFASFGRQMVFSGPVFFYPFFGHKRLGDLIEASCQRKFKPKLP